MTPSDDSTRPGGNAEHDADSEPTLFEWAGARRPSYG